MVKALFQVHPLTLPEIIAKIASFLPLWKYSESLGFYDFNPSFLLSCTRVSKTWKAALLPVIWLVFDGFTMRQIPKEILVRNSSHFRLFFGDCLLGVSFQCRHLRELSISRWDKDLLQLIRENAPSLECFSWKATQAPSSTMPNLDYDLITQMAPTLQNLSLSHWVISGRQFVQFLAQCRRLTSLNLTAVHWIDPIPQRQTYSCDNEFASLYHFHRGLGIRQLSLDISEAKNGAFVDLIQRCPDLESFSLYSVRAQDPKLFIPVLRQSCPKLTNIEYTVRYCSRLGLRDYLSEDGYADFVLASPRLTSVKMDVPWLGDALTSALLFQAAALESLSLQFYEHREDQPWANAENLLRILKNSRRLKRLSLLFSRQALGEEETLRLLEPSWGCEELESLTLTGLTMMCDRPSPIPCSPQFQWRFPGMEPVQGSDRSGGQDSIGSVQAPAQASPKHKLIELVQRMPKLEALNLNLVTFSLEGLRSHSWSACSLKVETKSKIELQIPSLKATSDTRQQDL
ncbi:hypothetical protein BGW38_001618 [Lunasporangiospora selenospora]|uniref:F-box domain-containing protein n=1 Tax=Lunasporangiospora selenospora TaxID=979761 RepID=A0A9P6FU34_9FUNG|nr:hypothetical protein BGW38_001618 [Lunasporangiospora selenospora]